MDFSATSITQGYLRTKRERKRERERERERETDRQTDRQAGRQAGRQADRQTERQTETQTDRQTNRQTGGAVLICRKSAACKLIPSVEVGETKRQPDRQGGSTHLRC